MALEHRAPHLAFTYNEPTIWGEYVIDIAREAHDAGLNTVMVSNGYITREAFFDIYRYIDAANIDLKAFTEEFYGKITLTHLQPVLDTLKWLRHETGVWFEITNLIIPTLNDGDSEFKELCGWVLENLGDDVPLHFTAFHPDFKLQRQAADAAGDAASRAPHRACDGAEVCVRGQHPLRWRKHDLPGMQAGGHHALVALGDVEQAEERLLRELRHADRGRVHESRSGEAAGVDRRATVNLTVSIEQIPAQYELSSRPTAFAGVEGSAVCHSRLHAGRQSISFGWRSAAVPPHFAQASTLGAKRGRHSRSLIARPFQSTSARQRA